MNKEQIIERFGDPFGYVADIEGVLSYLKDNKLSLEETNQLLFAIFEWNQQVTSKLQVKNRVLKVKTRTEKNKEEKEDEKDDFSPTINPQAQLYDVKQYMNAISNCNDLDFITDILPSPYDSHYDDIILSIILNLYQEISFATQEVRTSQDEEEREYFLEERARDHQIIRFIQSYNEEEEKEVEEEASLEVENHLVYLTNLNHVPYILGDIEDIHSEDYSTTLELIQKLRKGMLGKEKRFSNSSELTEISALRYRDSRVIFTRVAPNTILVLGIFTKRLQNTTWYQDFIRNRAGMYRSQKEEIVDLAKEEAYCKENEEITSCVLNKLASRSEKRKMRGEN